MGSWVLGNKLLTLADDLTTRDGESKLRLRSAPATLETGSTFE